VRRQHQRDFAGQHPPYFYSSLFKILDASCSFPCSTSMELYSTTSTDASVLDYETKPGHRKVTDKGWALGLPDAYTNLDIRPTVTMARFSVAYSLRHAPTVPHPEDGTWSPKVLPREGWLENEDLRELLRCANQGHSCECDRANQRRR
jgi:hypothetical protein